MRSRTNLQLRKGFVAGFQDDFVGFTFFCNLKACITCIRKYWGLVFSARGERTGLGPLPGHLSRTATDGRYEVTFHKRVIHTGNAAEGGADPSNSGGATQRLLQKRLH